MNAKALAEILSPQQLQLNDLLLDPNNPRFSELGEELTQIPEARFAEARVQEKAKERMRSKRFDVLELRDTIKALGFLPMDRIVVRRWKGASDDGAVKYVVVEGNRRVTALKWLIELNDEAKETFSDKQLGNFTQLESLVIDDDALSDSVALILPGLRHVSGVKEWGAYQKAKAVHALRKSGMTPQETAQSLGLSTRSANNSFRCYLALEQMKADEEFGERAQDSMYSYFEEVLKRPVVRDWLEWSDDGEGFSNSARLNEFYSWIVPSDEDGSQPKITMAIQIRDLQKVIVDENALAILRSPEGSLQKALVRYEVEHPEDWQPRISAATSALKSLTTDAIRKMDVAAVDELKQLAERISQVLKDRTLLTEKTS